MNKKWQEKHKPTFLSSFLPKNEDQNITLVFCENLDLQNRLQCKLAVSYNTCQGGRMSIYTAKITCDWLKELLVGNWWLVQERKLDYHWQFT
jgi:hypothetical protein